MTTKKYKYIGENAPVVLEGKEIYLEKGKVYDLNADLKRVKTLLNLGYLKEIVGITKTTTPVKKEIK